MRGVEAKLLPQRNFRYHLLPAEPIYRSQWWKNARWPFVGVSLLRRLSRLFREEHPVAVLGTGGYASATGGLVGEAWAYPPPSRSRTRIPGLSNRWLAKRVQEIYLGLPEAMGAFREGPDRAHGRHREPHRDAHAGSAPSTPASASASSPAAGSC